jgi:large subunit ribosomal protein L30
MNEKIAVVLVRGSIGVSRPMRDTLLFLNLKRKNGCTVLDKTPTVVGMVRKVKDLVTWGEVSPETINRLKKHTKNRIISLHPPRKGFGRKGIKAPFSIGGALGYRGEKMNDLIERMTWS